MKIIYDPSVDALTIRFVEERVECEVICLNDQVAVDIGPGRTGFADPGRKRAVRPAVIAEIGRTVDGAREVNLETSRFNGQLIVTVRVINL